MLWMYMAMLETAEQKDKIAYIYENYAGMMYHVAIGVVGEHYLAERSNPNPNHCPLGHLWRRFHRK